MYNVKYGEDLINGFVLPFAIFIVTIIVIKNCLDCLGRKQWGDLVLNIIVGSVVMILFTNSHMFTQIGDSSIEIFTIIFNNLFNIKELT